MIPKTKFQKKIVELSQQLPCISQKQKLYAYKHCLDHEATRLKNGVVTCLDCGHKWKDTHTLATTLDCTCLNCDTKLKVIDTRKQKFHDWAYYGIVTTFKGFQVFRYYKVIASYKVGEPISCRLFEVAQIWLSPDGKYEIVGYIHQTGWYAESWSGKFELRGRNSTYNYDIKTYKTYPSKSLIPEIKRNGFKGQCYGYSLFSFLYLLLTDYRVETLLKTGQYDLIKLYRSIDKDLIKYWSAIKICIRNNYIVENASLWIDYIKFLDYFKKDIHNAKYVCPKNLKDAHDYWMLKRNKAEEKRMAEEKREQLLRDEAEFEKLKGRFFGVVFSDGHIKVRVLESIQEYINEGRIMHHCVGSYALHKESLVLSACIGEEHIETVEISLKTFEVIQCRGLQNGRTEYHDRIIHLVTKNMRLIKERTNKRQNVKLTA